MEVDPTQQNAPNPCESDVPRGGTYLWLRGHQLKRGVEFFVQRLRRLCSIVTPPTAGFLDVRCRTTSEDDREAGTHF
jgi:hypothetical protein